MMRIIIPAVMNVVEPCFIPETNIPVHKGRCIVQKPPTRFTKLS